jgi:hypothetical protein
MQLLCWNIQWCRGVDGVVDPARVAREARRFDPDVICLQEVAANFPDMEGSRGEDQPLLLAREFPGYAIALVSGVDLPGEPHRKRFGNLILSRLPMGRVMRYSLPWPAAPDVPTMPRVAVEAVIEAPFGPLRIITTHLEFFSSVPSRGADRAAGGGPSRGAGAARGCERRLLPVSRAAGERHRLRRLQHAAARSWPPAHARARLRRRLAGAQSRQAASAYVSHLRA